jgi:hypothetical protein
VTEPLLIDAPTRQAGLALAEKLSLLGARAELVSHNGRVRVTVPLQSAGRELVPRTLAAIREWLEELDLGSTSVHLDGHTHLLRADRSSIAAQG